MPDQTLTCQDCASTFLYTERDQAFYASKTDERTGRPWDPPKRYGACRRERKLNKPKQDQQRY